MNEARQHTILVLQEAAMVRYTFFVVVEGVDPSRTMDQKEERHISTVSTQQLEAAIRGNDEGYK